MHILFIVNPISGGGKFIRFEKALGKNHWFAQHKNNYDIQYTTAAGEATLFARQALSKYDVIVAVGGDGTVNEVAHGLVNSKIPMAIIPLGSGNGLARHMGIPVKITDAIETILNGKVYVIDSGLINNHFFVNISGVGLDAKIAHRFASSKKRGFINYVKSCLIEYINYKPDKCILETENETLNLEQSVLICFANSSQFGNNAFIAPEADIADGMFDICILKTFPWYMVFNISYRLFAGSIHKSKYLKIYRTGQCNLICESGCFAHIDGEPVILEKMNKIQIMPSSVSIIAP